jgi:hypothetical protein
MKSNGIESGPGEVEETVFKMEINSGLLNGWLYHWDESCPKMSGRVSSCWRTAAKIGSVGAPRLENSVASASDTSAGDDMMVSPCRNTTVGVGGDDRSCLILCQTSEEEVLCVMEETKEDQLVFLAESTVARKTALARL